VRADNRVDFAGVTGRRGLEVDVQPVLTRRLNFLLGILHVVGFPVDCAAVPLGWQLASILVSVIRR
jgi:hypothetical protein